ncbi:hypothetical protein L226DRAFT_617898 [Lentinus tigrinus ALCF2SS1-7]|uniref:Wax synthase domain-containing protein n=1 Tax=Lentinus tigrinus ALCF2SS1-6 TaxID=1328759 RepID=A0A5C2RMR5_9APHY|nr:hypothetical protein L227DRAFT_596624 [Lentinus tigrinus ALCF2SS1-6]RPD67614.1 hypothetical protein L226DRAFT_617898 [Lentinus tigrinus ALCF2SS1-7]
MADAKIDRTLLEPRAPFNALTQLLLPEVALALLMALKLPFILKAAISCVILGNILHTVLTTTTGATPTDYSVGSSNLGNLFFNVLLFVWIVDPMTELRYVRDEDPSPLASRSLLARVYNASCIIRNYRLIGWNVQKSITHTNTSRAQFLRYQFRQFLWSFLLTDLAESYVHAYRARLDARGPPLPGGFLLHSWGLLACAVTICLSAKIFYEIASLLAVGLGFSQPQDWPDLFGSISDAYTLRRLWARTWHQMFGRHFSSWGKLVVRMLRIPRGTWLSSQTQVYTAFLVSALLHSFGDIMVDKREFGRSFPFFLSQAAAITFEDTVIALGKSYGIAGGKEGPPRAIKVLGYAWVLLWLQFSGPMYVDWLYEARIVGDPFLPFSPVRSLLVPSLERIIKP